MPMLPFLGVVEKVRGHIWESVHDLTSFLICITNNETINSFLA